MVKKIIIPILLVGILGLAGVVGFAATQVVQAAAPASQGVADFNFGKAGPGGVSDQDLAAALGISVEKLQAAYQAANEEALKQAVSSGKLTQGQADKMKERGLSGRNRIPLKGVDYNSLLANALGVSAEKLTAAYQQAFLAGLDRAVADGKITKEQADDIKARQALSTSTKFQSALKSAFEAAVKQAVSDGLITQAQADKILSATADRGMAPLMGKFPGVKGIDRGMSPGGFERMPRGKNGPPSGMDQQPNRQPKGQPAQQATPKP